VARALLIYESMFGNTRDVAVAIAEGLATRLAVDVVEVGAAPLEIPDDVDLVVAGGPTHAHGLANVESRRSAGQKARDSLVSPGIGLREWLGAARGRRGTAAAAFDTRIKGPGILWGSAAKSAGKHLGALGFRVVVPPESFLVGGPTGSMYDRLAEGELERARAWGVALAEKLATLPASSAGSLPAGTAAGSSPPGAPTGAGPSPSP
jgi:hypothetical protein